MVLDCKLWGENASALCRGGGVYYSLGQKFWQTMHVTQNCHQAEYPSAYWPAVLHAFMGAQHSHAHVT
jgi:hypothetical protein